MSKEQEEIIRQLKALKRVSIITEPAIVKSVDESKRTCTVTIDNNDIEDIRLNAVIDDNANTSFIVPVVNSWVLISYIAGSESDAFIGAYSEIDKFIAKANNIDATITDIVINGLQGLVINNGNNAGLVKVIELTQKLNNIENDINSLKSIINSWVPVPNDGGAALKSAASSWAGQQLTPTQQADIENDIIKH